MKIDSAEVARLYVEQSVSPKDIAEMYGITRNHVYKLLEKRGIKRDRIRGMLQAKPRYSSLIERLEGKYMPEPNSGCWLWDATMFDDGYGAIVIDGKRLKAHRVSFIAYKGDIPEGMKLLHKCDVRCCINPNHLRPGTQADNQQDMKQKRRSTYGERSGNAKLTDAAVRNIRTSNFSNKALAAEYGVSAALIGRVRRYVCWEHVKV